jgi:hypothetical protein
MARRTPGRSKRWMLALSLPLIAVPRARAEDSIGFSHQTYAEEHDRIQVQTETAEVHQTITPWMDLTLHGVYDGISGATPIGAPPIQQLKMRDPRTGLPIPSSTITGYTRTLDGMSGASQTSGPVAIPHDQVPLADSPDQRWAGDIALGLTHGSHRLVPQFSYSSESDYRSYGFSLNYYYDFNQKNTTLNLGWSHAYDQVLATEFTFLTHDSIKNTDDFFIGLTQLLSPTTVLSANATIGHAHGYLSDPYRGVVFNESDLSPDNEVVLSGENRPSMEASKGPIASITIPTGSSAIRSASRASKRSASGWSCRRRRVTTVKPPPTSMAFNSPAIWSTIRVLYRSITRPITDCRTWNRTRWGSKQT